MSAMLSLEQLPSFGDIGFIANTSYHRPWQTLQLSAMQILRTILKGPAGQPPLQNCCNFGELQKIKIDAFLMQCLEVKLQISTQPRTIYKSHLVFFSGYSSLEVRFEDPTSAFFLKERQNGISSTASIVDSNTLDVVSPTTSIILGATGLNAEMKERSSKDLFQKSASSASSAGGSGDILHQER